MEGKKVYANGIHIIENEDYHASAGLSRSALMEFKKSPLHYHAKYMQDAEPREPTPAMAMGELVHTLVLEHKEYEGRFVVQGKYDRRTSIGKQAHGAFMMSTAGRSVITQEQLDIAHKIAASVKTNELAESLLKDCKIEESIYFTHAATGLQCKVRPDAWNGLLSGSIVVDLKTTVDASFRAFQGSSWKYGYYLQAGCIHEAMKSIGIKMEKFVFLAVEKEFPHAVGIYILDDEALDYGVNQFNTLMQNYQDCLTKNSWPGYPLQTLTLPGYAKFDFEQEIDHE